MNNISACDKVLEVYTIGLSKLSWQLWDKTVPKEGEASQSIIKGAGGTITHKMFGWE